MITTKVKRKVIVATVEIKSYERTRAVDIKLPANVVKVTGIMATGSWKFLEP